MRRNLLLNFVTFVTIFLSLTSNAQDRPAAAPAARPAVRMPARIISPAIQPDNTVIFRLYSKDASKVTVSGEWQQGYGASESMQKNDTGLFTLTVGLLKPVL